MKFCRKDLENKEKYDELNVFLTEKIDENPLETAKIILNIALKFRQSSVLYSDNILFLEHVAQFATFHKSDKKILETCINAIGEFGGLSKDENCKWFCFNFLKSFKNDEDKKIKYVANLLTISLYPDFFMQEPDFFEDAMHISSLAPREHTMKAFAVFISGQINNIRKEDLSNSLKIFDEYSKSSRNIFTKQEYKKLAETLSKHVEGKITLKASELTSIATDYAIKQTRKIANINKP
jgi:hypothetical protein